MVSGPEAPKTPLKQVVPAQILTNAGDYPEKVVHLLVHSCGDDLHAGESIGDGVDTHLRHEQGEEEDLVFWDIMVLRERHRDSWGEGV